MTFKWLKQYMPRGIYGRAALILILPVVTLQLVVSVVFIQRHFEGVTEQMTGTISRAIELVLKDYGTPQGASVSQALAIRVAHVEPQDVPTVDSVRWYDLSGRVVVRSLRHLVPGVRAVNLPDDHDVHVYIERGGRVLRVSFDRSSVSASNPHQLLVNMVVFGLLMTVIAYLYLRNQLKPITRLAKAADAFGRGRHIPYKPGGAVEVRAAGAAFVDMRARIERHIEQRTLMLSGVSHDLRTPLTRMKLAVEMLEPEDRKMLEPDIEEMQRMLNEFLSFARGTAEEVTTDVNPSELIRDVVADAKRAGQNVTVIEDLGEGQIALRPFAIRRAVENLIGNAVRYGTKAEISVELTSRALRIRVEDDGPGIPPEKREEAQKPFARLEPSRNQNLGSGVGLGLAIAVDIARNHGGTLRLGESERLGGLCADIVIGR